MMENDFLVATVQESCHSFWVQTKAWIINNILKNITLQIKYCSLNAL